MSRRVALASAAVAAMLTAPAAHAMASHYECSDGSVLEVSFTPKLAQVSHNGKSWTLTRLRAAGAAQYAGRGVQLASQRSEAVLHVNGKEWRCTLQRGASQKL